MTLLNIHHLTYYVGERALYDKACLQIHDKDKIALIGRNGTGKSTLLHLIMGQLQPDQGTIKPNKTCTIGFLHQDFLSYQLQDTIRHVAMQAFKEVLTIQDAIDLVLKKMEAAYTDDLVHQLTTLQEKFEQHQGYRLQAKTDEVLMGMGFSTQDLERPMSQFSGGWRTRVLLAKLLLQQPQLLLLDEPTNHLDLPAIVWLEQYLQQYPGAVMIVSHDRDFLERTTNKTVEVQQKRLNVYAGNYGFYLQEKQLQQSIQTKAYDNQQKHIKQTERFIERFRSKASKAKQVQSRVKNLDKLPQLTALETTARIQFRFPEAVRSGRLVAALSHVDKNFGQQVILKDANVEIERGDKIALIGANGKGKSTVLRMVAAQESMQHGTTSLGHQVHMAFYAQHQLEALHLTYTILQELQATAPEATEKDIRTLLGMFLFKKEDVFKKITVLSGGEKTRVALAKILLTPANFLLLDEPTNHLDMTSVDILIQALQQYQGTFVLVSHDRHLITHVATKIWYIEDAQIKVYPGTYTEFIAWKATLKAAS